MWWYCENIERWTPHVRCWCVYDQTKSDVDDDDFKVSTSNFTCMNQQRLVVTIVCTIVKLFSELCPSRHLLVQSQQIKHQKNGSNLFKVNNKDIRITSLTSGIFIDTGTFNYYVITKWQKFAPCFHLLNLGNPSCERSKLYINPPHPPTPYKNSKSCNFVVS